MDGSRGNFLKFKKGAQTSMLHNRETKINKFMNKKEMRNTILDRNFFQVSLEKILFN